jgi:hypothetical protein
VSFLLFAALGASGRRVDSEKQQFEIIGGIPQRSCRMQPSKLSARDDYLECSIAVAVIIIIMSFAIVIPSSLSGIIIRIKQRPASRIKVVSSRRKACNARHYCNHHHHHPVVRLGVSQSSVDICPSLHPRTYGPVCLLTVALPSVKTVALTVGMDYSATAPSSSNAEFQYPRNCALVSRTTTQ